MPSSLQPRLTTWQQNKIMESFTWDAEKEKIVYIGELYSDIKKEDASGTFTIPLPSGENLGGTITATYELLNSGRVLLQYDFAVNVATTIPGSEGDEIINISRNTNTEYDAFCKAIEKVVSKTDGIVLYGIIPVARNSSNDVAGATFTSISAQLAYSNGAYGDMSLTFNYQMGGGSEDLYQGAFIQGNINSII